MISDTTQKVYIDKTKKYIYILLLLLFLFYFFFLFFFFITDTKIITKTGHLADRVDGYLGNCMLNIWLSPLDKRWTILCSES